MKSENMLWRWKFKTLFVSVSDRLKIMREKHKHNSLYCCMWSAQDFSSRSKSPLSFPLGCLLWLHQLTQYMLLRCVQEETVDVWFVAGSEEKHLKTKYKLSVEDKLRGTAWGETNTSRGWRRALLLLCCWVFSPQDARLLWAAVTVCSNR